MDEGAWLANSPWGRKELDTTERLLFLSFFPDPHQDRLVPQAHAPGSWLLVHSHIL